MDTISSRLGTHASSGSTQTRKGMIDVITEVIKDKTNTSSTATTATGATTYVAAATAAMVSAVATNDGTAVEAVATATTCAKGG